MDEPQNSQPVRSGDQMQTPPVFSTKPKQFGVKTRSLIVGILVLFGVVYGMIRYWSEEQEVIEGTIAPLVLVVASCVALIFCYKKTTNQALKTLFTVLFILMIIFFGFLWMMSQIEINI